MDLLKGRLTKVISRAPANKGGARTALEEAQAEGRHLAVGYGEALSKAERLEADRARIEQALDSARRAEAAADTFRRQLQDLGPQIEAAKVQFGAVSDAVRAAGLEVSRDLEAARTRAQGQFYALEAQSTAVVNRLQELSPPGAHRLESLRTDLARATAEAQNAKVEADALGAELRAARARVGELESAAKAETAEALVALEAEDRRLAATLDGQGRAAVESARELAERLWKIRAEVRPIVSRRDDILKEVAQLQGSKERWWSAGDQRGFIFLGVAGTGTSASDLAEILGAVAADVRGRR